VSRSAAGLGGGISEGSGLRWCDSTPVVAIPRGLRGVRWLHDCTCRRAKWIGLLGFCAERFRGRPRIAFQSKLHFPKAARGRARTSKVRRRTDSSRGELVVKAGSVLCFACFFYFFENFAARFPEKDIRGRRLRHKTGLRRFWRWSSRESAWPISKLISAMGGTLGASTKGDATLATFLVVVPAAF
jgi:hypothetical protein